MEASTPPKAVRRNMRYEGGKRLSVESLERRYSLTIPKCRTNTTWRLVKLRTLSTSRRKA